MLGMVDVFRTRSPIPYRVGQFTDKPISESSLKKTSGSNYRYIFDKLYNNKANSAVKKRMLAREIIEKYDRSTSPKNYVHYEEAMKELKIKYPKKSENQNKKPFGERFNRATIEKAVRLFNDNEDSMTPSQRKAAKDILYRKAYNSARRGTLTLKRRRYLKMVGIDIPASNRTRRPRRVRKEETVLNSVENP